MSPVGRAYTRGVAQFFVGLLLFVIAAHLLSTFIS